MMAIAQRDLAEDYAVCKSRRIRPAESGVFHGCTAGAHARNAEEFFDASLRTIADGRPGIGEFLPPIRSGWRTSQWLAPGYEADIIALDGDPVADLTAVRRVVPVMRGVVYKWTGCRNILGAWLSTQTGSWPPSKTRIAAARSRAQRRPT